MPLVWNPNTFQYDYATGGFAEDQATEDALRKTAGTIVGALDPTTQYAMAAESVMPGYADRPYLSRSLGQSYNPLYGQYLTGYGGYKEEIDPNEQSFAQWLRNRQVPVETTDPTGVRYTPPPFLQGQWADPGGTATPTNWADIIRVARSMSEVDPLNRGASALSGFETDIEKKDAVTRWAGMLADPGQAGALASMATYDPKGGSIFGRLRREGIGRAQQQYVQGAPGATSADWLGYLARQDWVPTRYKV